MRKASAPLFKLVFRFDASQIVAGSARHRRRKPHVAAVEQQFRLLEAHGRRVGNRHRGVLKRQLPLPASLLRISDRAVDCAIHLEAVRQLRPQVPRQLQQRLHAKTIPVERHAPMGTREVIRHAEPHGKRRRFLRGRMRIHFQPFRGNVQPPFKLERPAGSVLRQQIPAVHVFHVERSVDVQIRQRTRQMRARRNRAMHPEVVPVDQADHLVDGAPFELHVEIQFAR